jgi:hypothetical protein
MMAPPPSAPPSQAATMFMQGPGGGATPMSAPVSPAPPMGGMGGPPPPMGGMGGPPPPMGGMGGPPPPMGGMGGPPPPMMQPPPPAPQPMMQPHTAIVQAPQPPYLASQTAARMGAPVEPFNAGLQTALIVFGVLLLAAFVVPLSTKRDTLFWWDALDEIKDGKLKVVPILLAAAGALGILFGSIPLAATARGAGAAALGIIALLYGALAVPAEFAWQGAVGVGGGILLPAGLLLRSAYKDQMLGRALATVGALCVLAVWLVPVDGNIPIQGLFDMMTSDAKTPLKVAAAVRLLYPVLAVIALVVWIPAPSSAGGTGLAWAWILTPIVVHYAIMIATGKIGDAAADSPFMTFFSGVEAAASNPNARGEAAQMALFLTPSGIIAAGYTAFAGFGLAALLGKNLER